MTSIVKVGKALWPLAARVALRTTTQGMVSVDHIVKARDALVGGEDIREELIMQRVTSVVEGRQCIDGFRERLSGFAQELTNKAPEGGREDGTNGVAGKRKLVFVIDELDRCRPPFALGLLERVKHIFSVESVCFVLVAHLRELAKVVERGATESRMESAISRSFISFECNCRGQRKGIVEVNVRRIWDTWLMQ